MSKETSTLLPENRSPNGSENRRRGRGNQILKRRESFSRDFGHAAAETYMITGLAFTLLRYLGLGYQWLTRFAALALYASLLMPGFLRVGYHYFFSKQVRRSIIYGTQPRNRLDLYIPVNLDQPKPVVVFVIGGAWIIGYKAWGSLFGLQMVDRDIIVACIDYRNFPQGTISDMVADASEGISFVCNNIAQYGGDPNRIYLMGQSAGAHIAACALIEQAHKEASGSERLSWNISMIRYFCGLSGGYNLCNLVDHFHNRGLRRSIFLSIMEGQESLHRFSPELRIRENSDIALLLPPCLFFHGTEDFSIPPDSSQSFVDTLQKAGATATLVLFDGKTHTDLFVQDPLRGGRDEMLEHLIHLIHNEDVEAMTKDKMAPLRTRLVPEVLLKMASKVSPF